MPSVSRPSTCSIRDASLIARFFVQQPYSAPVRGFLETLQVRPDGCAPGCR